MQKRSAFGVDPAKEAAACRANLVPHFQDKNLFLNVIDLSFYACIVGAHRGGQWVALGTRSATLARHLTYERIFANSDRFGKLLSAGLWRAEPTVSELGVLEERLC